MVQSFYKNHGASCKEDTLTENSSKSLLFKFTLLLIIRILWGLSLSGNTTARLGIHVYIYIW